MRVDWTATPWRVICERYRWIGGLRRVQPCQSNADLPHAPPLPTSSLADRKLDCVQWSPEAVRLRHGGLAEEPREKTANLRHAADPVHPSEHVALLGLSTPSSSPADYVTPAPQRAEDLILWYELAPTAAGAFACSAGAASAAPSRKPRQWRATLFWLALLSLLELGLFWLWVQ